MTWTTLEAMIFAHMQATHSDLAWKILCMWDNVVRHFVKVMPRDYKLMLQAFNQVAARQHRSGRAMRWRWKRLS